MLFNFTALGLLTLEKSAAFGFVSPIYATIFAVLILKEKIRIYRVTALIIGFIGVIIIAQPSLSGVEKGVYFALLGQLCFGLTMVLIKKMSYKDSSLTILSVIMPLMWPGVITTGLFSFLLAYNDYLVCALLLDGQSQTMVPAIMQYFNMETTMTDLVESIAAAASITLPLFILVMFFQKQIVSGLTQGSVKG